MATSLIFGGSGSNGNAMANGGGDRRIPYTGGGQAHNNLQPYMTAQYVIKT